MPFLGKDWRNTGDLWCRVGEDAGWERVKLRPIQIAASSESSLGVIVCDTLVATAQPVRRQSSSASFSSSGDESATALFGSSPGAYSLGACNEEGECAVQAESEDEEWIPHCFVKTNRSKEFIGCTSMSEAFHRLDLARAVEDVRRFNYVCKVVQIFAERMQNLSGTARKHLFAIIQAVVIHSFTTDSNLSTARDLIARFASGLADGQHVYGSSSLRGQQQQRVSILVDTLVGMIAAAGTQALPDSSEESSTFLDLPREILAEILRRLPDHNSMLECAKAHESLGALVTANESRLWRSLVRLHFTPEQIARHQTTETPWRRLFYTLKKYHGLKEHYADLVVLCCACKALFWKDIGHPCLTSNAPFVRVMPAQFVDMLTDL